MSETSAESLRVPPVRPPSCISMLAERLKCSNLNDLGFDCSEARFMRRSTRRPKAVNFSNDEICDIIPNISQQRSSTTSSDVDGSPITCDSGNEDSSESWSLHAYMERAKCVRTFVFGSRTQFVGCCECYASRADAGLVEIFYFPHRLELPMAFLLDLTLPRPINPLSNIAQTTRAHIAAAASLTTANGRESSPHIHD
ncbi:unnamed protein product [Rodentolepis nana]|uniref:Uncharacterized protein n=1 Tax=Rodentolepis nana TaxID=102285 RepID=A0A0R3TBQ8_RODNA|nr:unnamed protein product [Rodentolepis nana]